MVKITQQQLATQLQKMQTMMQTMQMQYSAAPQQAHLDYGIRGYNGGHNNYFVQRVRGAQRKENWQGGQCGWGNSDITH